MSQKSKTLQIFIPSKPGGLRDNITEELLQKLVKQQKEEIKFGTSSNESHSNTMVSERKKKRPSTSSVVESNLMSPTHEIKDGEPSPKKTKQAAVSPKKVPMRHPKAKKHGKVASKSNGRAKAADEPFWPEADLLELIRKIEINIPPKDSLKFNSRAQRFDWQSVSFGDYDGEQCKEMWGLIQKRLRRYRLLKEIVEDAKAWVSQPWTNFYRSTKLNRHPDQPRRPLSTYMIFYLDKKDKVAKENPTLEMTEISKKIAFMYKNLTEKQKQKFVQKAAQQRQEYEVKLEAFYKQHPELVPKVSKREKSTNQTYPGPKKPMTPYQLFFLEKQEKHKNDPNVDKSTLSEMYRQQWKVMNEKKKMAWISAALEDEHRYQEELKVYVKENPDFTPLNMKGTLTREEKLMKERSSGKPEKPPNSGYSLFSRIMLTSEEIKHFNSKQRMAQISSMWRDLNAKDKRKYTDKVQQMLEQYKLDFATYLESLTPEKQEEELQASQHRKKPAAPRKTRVKAEVEEEEEEESSQDEEESADTPSPTPPKKLKKEKRAVLVASKAKKEKPEQLTAAKPKVKLYKGEPEPPPVMAYKLFLKSFMADATHNTDVNRMKEAPRYWQMLPESEKTKYRKKLVDLKQKYIANYEKFLKGLSQEQLKEYSLLKAKCKQSEEEEEEEEGEEGSREDEDSEDGSDQESGSDKEDDDEAQQSDEDSASSSASNSGGSSGSDSSSDSDSDSD